jgi:hypothetical protein
MTTFEKSIATIAEQIEKHKGESPVQVARRCLDAMRKKRIVPQTLRASEEMFTRFHAHCRHLGNVTGRGYEHYYNKAIGAAVKTEDWPVKIIPRRIRLDTGQIVDVDIPIPLSSTKVSTGALMAAYQVIEDEAKEHEVDLPEGE